jgi:glycosyltransferase involved in cell wall biosynthesis
VNSPATAQHVPRKGHPPHHSRPGPDIVYLLGTMPQPSQTFIAREIRGLLASGSSLLIFARRRHPRAEPEDVDRAWFNRIRFVPPGFALEVARANLHFLRRQPGRYLRTLAALLTLPHRPRVLAVRAIGLFWIAAWIARELEPAPSPARIHAHFGLAQTEVAMVIGGLIDRPFSFTAHARDIYATPSALAQKMRAAETVVTCTAYNAAHLRQLCPDLPADHVRLVYHGVEMAPQPAPATRRAGAPPLLLAAGRLIDKKGFDLLVAACAILRDRGRSFECRIAGDGPARAALQQQIDAADLALAVTLSGWVDAGAMPDLIREAAILVMPSRIAPRGDRDGIPNVVLEAMAIGRPVVATRVSGIPEAVEDRRTGVLVAPDDAGALAEALDRLLADPDGASAMGLAAHAAALERFELARSTYRLRSALGLMAAGEPPHVWRPTDS